MPRIGILLLLLVLPDLALAQLVDGSRPRNLAVHSSGSVLVTSMGSESVTFVPWDSTNGFGTPDPISIGGTSWGICLVDDDLAVITLPFEDHMVRLEWSGTEWETAGTIPVPLYCTEVIAHPSNPELVFVANRGATPDQGQLTNPPKEWQHAVYEIDVTTGLTSGSRRFVADREPRVMAVSPDGNRLFVGYIQGALGQPSYDPQNNTEITYDPDFSNPIYDGGSVVMFDLENGSQDIVYRFGVGSPVRGIAMLQTGGTDDYRVYFTNVGFGAAAEDPDFGGQMIPNVISTIAFESHVPVGDDEHVILGHFPELLAAQSLEPDDIDPNQRLVLPERLVVRTGTQNELWVIHSGAGTVCAIKLGAGGTFATAGSQTLTFPRVLPNPERTDGFLLTPDVDSEHTESYPMVANFNCYTVSNAESNPRALVWDHADGRDRILAVGQLSHELMELEIPPSSDPTSGAFGGTPSFVDLLDGATDPVGEDERDFFVFGKGFQFRQTNHGPEGASNGRDEFLTEPEVDNITCATCHVEGHLDGKLRFIDRTLQMVGQAQEDLATIFVPQKGRFKPVTVPSVFDMGQTEWMFHEGQKTIRDGKPLTESSTPLNNCSYCFNFGFFFSTNEFTRTLASPVSPDAPNRTLEGNQRRGRMVFESLNCSRCHGGVVRQAFLRTNVPPGDLPDNPPDDPGNDAMGPLPNALLSISRLLHDPTQVFVQDDVNEGQAQNSFRNVTVVGTRGANDARVNGVNTPSLAGTWDNRPYMHDGRYRTLDEILANTYVDTTDANRAAFLVFEGTPDNLLGPNAGPTQELDDTLSIADPGQQQYNFAVHGHDGFNRKTNFRPVVERVSEDDYNALKAFLSATSSETELCDLTGSELISGFDADTDGSFTTVSWETTVPVECLVEWSYSGQPATKFLTEYGTTHSHDLLTPAAGEYVIRITAYMRTVCEEPVFIDESFEVETSTVTVQTNTPVTACPEGDADDLVITVTLSADIGDVDAERLTIGPSLAPFSIFDSSTEADFDANANNDYETTITVSEMGGCLSPSVCLPVMLDSVFVGCASATVRTPDFGNDGVVGANDFATFGNAFSKCSSDPGYYDCADLVPSGCVDAGDFGLFGVHYLHEAANLPPNFAITMYSDIVLNYEVKDAGDGSADVYFYAGQASSAEQLVLDLALEPSLSLLSAWLPASGSTALTLPNESDGLVVCIGGIERVSTAQLLGKITVASRTGADRLGDVVTLASGTASMGDGRQLALRPFGETAPVALKAFNELRQNYPNPFNPTTVIGYSLEKPGMVSLRVYNVQGQLVKILFEGLRAADHHAVEWNGRNETGQQVGTGVYFYRLEAPGFAQTRKMVLLK